jgi:hypothetical protein
VFGEVSFLDDMGEEVEVVGKLERGVDFLEDVILIVDDALEIDNEQVGQFAKVCGFLDLLDSSIAVLAEIVLDLLGDGVFL